MKKLLIIDTSILCCWLEVPGKETAGTLSDLWTFDRVDQLLGLEKQSDSQFVLPIATLIETGNHIAQCNGERYNLARKLTSLLESAVEGTSPWMIFSEQSTLWEKKQLAELVEGWPSLAAQRLTIGDATIKQVADYYASTRFVVEILTGDAGLKAYEPSKPPLVPRRRQ